MSLLQKALETYDAMESLAGVVESPDKEPLAPIGHICTKASIDITIDKNGKFIQAQKIDQKIVIPVTEASAGRTSISAKDHPHPLCDRLDYISSNIYLEQLSDWLNDIDNDKLNAIYQYVKSGTIYEDLSKSEWFSEEKNSKDVVCWRVVGLGEDDSAVWTDRKLHEEFVHYYLNKLDTSSTEVSLISGEREVVAAQHLKGVFSSTGNAKIISSNDSVNFTYKGRFVTADEAVSIGYLDSQKSHNALKWVVSNQGVTIGNRVFICWNPQGSNIPRPLLPILKNNSVKMTPTEYSSDLYKTIMGYKTNLRQNAGVVIVSMEAATTGRLAITYYSELAGSDFLDRLAYWDETCCWDDSRWGTRSLSIPEIVRFAFGVQRNDAESTNIDIDERIEGQQVQRLLICKLEKALFPVDIMCALVQKTYHPERYNTKNRNRLLFVTCAAVRKYRRDRFKEEWSMALVSEKKDRSYQYGRLLAVMEKIETDVLNARGEARDTNAIRMQSIFVRRPAYATKIILDRLKNAYYPHLRQGQKIYYEKLIGEIMQVISECEDRQYDKPLSETYVMGYYLQKNALWEKKETIEEEAK